MNEWNVCPNIYAFCRGYAEETDPKLGQAEINVAKFRVWCSRHGFRSPQEAAFLLGVPETQILRFMAGDKRISVRIDLACIAYEYCTSHDPSEQKISGYYAAVQQRIHRFLELEPRLRDKDLAAALVLGLASVVRLEKGEWGQKEFLERAHDLLSHAPQWTRLAAHPGVISIYSVALAVLSSSLLEWF